MFESDEKLTQRGRRYLELDRMAYELGPNMDDTKLASLPLEEEAYVLSMAHLYMMYRLGSVSYDTAKQIKHRNIKRCERIYNKLLYARLLKQQQVICTKLYSSEYKILIDLIKSNSSLALTKALQIIDSMSGMYILSRIYRMEEEAPDSIGQAVEDISDEDTASLARKFVSGLAEDLKSGELSEFFEVLTAEELNLTIGRFPDRDRVDFEIPEEIKNNI